MIVDVLAGLMLLAVMLTGIVLLLVITNRLKQIHQSLKELRYVIKKR